MHEIEINVVVVDDYKILSVVAKGEKYVMYLHAESGVEEHFEVH